MYNILMIMYLMKMLPKRRYVMIHPLNWRWRPKPNGIWVDARRDLKRLHHPCHRRIGLSRVNIIPIR